MEIIYGYCRISTKKQNIERQERNILVAYPTAKIYKERYTGTKVQGRKELDKILRLVQKGDTIVFDSVSRMSRNAAEGIELYMSLLDRGVELVFLKEPHINTETYKQAISNSVELVGNEIADIYIEATNKVLRLLATRQIELAFGQAQKEVDDLHQRTAEGIETARRNGKQIGTPKGATLTVKKKAPALAFIKKHSQAFGGTLNDTQCAAAAKISRKTFYKYKYELQIKQLFADAPCVTADVLPYSERNENYLEQLQKCAAFLQEKYKGKVTGLWYWGVPADDGGMITFTRTAEKFEATKHNQLASDVSDFCGDEEGYIFVNDDVSRLSFLSEDLLTYGRLYTIFNSEKE